MCSTVCSVEPETTVRTAAALMAEFGTGVLPVLRGSHLVGIVTDRDLTVRATAAGLPGETAVSAVMTRGVHACHADEDVDDVLLDMALLQLRRMPVENEADEFVGMLSLGDLIAGCPDAKIGLTLRHICRTPHANPPHALQAA